MPHERRARAEQALAAAMARLPAQDATDRVPWREMVAGSFQAMVILSVDGAVLAANPYALETLGAEPDDAFGTPLWELAPWESPDDRARLRTAIAGAGRGVTARHEVTNADRPGAQTLDVMLTPLTAPPNDVVLVLAEWRDITLRVAADAALRESEERFHRIVDIAADGIISIDDSQRITLFNKGAEAIFGYTSAEATGQPLDMLLPRELAATHAKEVRAFGESPDASRRMGERRQIFGRRKSGEIFSAEASISKAMIGGERVFTAVVRDVTARWAAEQEKSELLAATQKARDAAERAARQRDEMLGIVSHDLRNPLSAIGMCAGILGDDRTPSDERRRLADTINESVDWAQRLIADLLDVASIEAGGLSVARKRVDPVITIARALSLFELSAAQRAINLRADGAEHLPQIDADPERLLQVLSNLIGNALKFTPEGGTVSVGAEAHDGSLVFSVRDTGSGIAAEHLARVFDRRWHGGSVAHGTGLGLTIARGIVQAHGGRVWVESSPGKGSVFQFSVPLPPTVKPV